jgi:hypothetical protein
LSAAGQDARNRVTGPVFETCRQSLRLMPEGTVQRIKAGMAG